MADSSWQFFQCESAKLKYKKSKVNGQSIKAKKKFPGNLEPIKNKRITHNS
jgi:hypothetical protein